MRFFEKMNRASLFVLMVAAFCGIFFACSSTSSSSSDADEEELPKNNGGTDSLNKADSLKLDRFNVAAEGEVLAKDGQKYKTLTVGSVTWMVENMNSEEPLLAKSTCYDYAESCDSDGRFYMENNYSDAEEVCPEGFTLPSIAAWKDLIAQGVDFNLELAGICDKNDTLECHDNKKLARYLAYGGEAIVLQKDAKGKISYEIQSVSTYGFYSLRCVKNRSIVTKLTDLPLCDVSNGNVPITMVVDSLAYYECSASDEKWLVSDSKACQESEKMDFFLSGDRLYVCDDRWRLATVSDVNVTCSGDNLEQEYLLNDKRNACTKEGWIVLEYPASELGYCGSKQQGIIATTSNGMTYGCTKNGWKEPLITDVYGECDETNRFKVVEFQKKSYFCDKGGDWRVPSALESSIGFCTDSLEGALKTEVYDLYKCESGEWYIADPLEYLDPCNVSKAGDTTLVSTSKFLCTGMGWISGTGLEDAHGFCVDAKNNSVVEYSGNYYKCIAEEYRWNEENFKDYAPPCDSTSVGEKITVGGVEYTCSLDHGGWYVPFVIPPIPIYPTTYPSGY